MSSKFASPFMAKSPLSKTLEKRVEEARRAAFIKSESDSEDYEKSREEIIAQRKYKRLRKRLDKKQEREEKKKQK